MKLTDERIDEITLNVFGFVSRSPQTRRKLARAIESEVLRINGLTAEAAEQREQGQAVDRSNAVNLARNLINADVYEDITPTGVRILCEAVLDMDAALLATHPEDIPAIFKEQAS